METSANQITGRKQFAIIFDVKNGNPNGDPDARNEPRRDPETDHGIVTDVCLKRKVRDYIQNTGRSEMYISNQTVLTHSQKAVHAELGHTISSDPEVSIKSEIADELEALINLSGDDEEAALASTGLSVVRTEDSCSLVLSLDSIDGDVAQAIDQIKKAKKSLGKKLSDDAKKALEKVCSVKAKKVTPEQEASGAQLMCQKFWDVRAFGAVMNSQPSCGLLRGPVQMTFSESVDPVATVESCITRMAVTNDVEAAKNDKNQTMGNKWTVPYGLYVGYGFVDPFLARKTGFSHDDFQLLLQALLNMFELDRSAARGTMAMRQVVVFEHENDLGNCSAHKLFDRIKITRKDLETVARNFCDYDIQVDRNDLPEGVSITILD